MVILTPMVEEYRIARERFRRPEDEIILAGVGPRNILNGLLRHQVPRDMPIVLFGFAGSNSLDIGTEVYATKSFLHHPTVPYVDEPEVLKRPELPGAPEMGVPCYSSADFVSFAEVDEPAIFDMELGFLTTVYSNVSAWRIVSDHLSLDEFREYLNSGR